MQHGEWGTPDIWTSPVYSMSNSELAEAIDRARQMVGGTSEDSPTYDHIVLHFKRLLDVQYARASLVSTTDKEG